VSKILQKTQTTVSESKDIEVQESEPQDRDLAGFPPRLPNQVKLQFYHNALSRSEFVIVHSVLYILVSLNA
jgi:hypothetical protein